MLQNAFSIEEQNLLTWKDFFNFFFQIPNRKKRHFHDSYKLWYVIIDGVLSAYYTSFPFISAVDHNMCVARETRCTIWWLTANCVASKTLNMLPTISGYSRIPLNTKNNESQEDPPQKTHRRQSPDALYQTKHCQMQMMEKLNVNLHSRPLE